MIKELEGKNRFRLQHILEMLIELQNSNNPLIQEVFKQLIKKSPEWFDEPHLIPIIEDFWTDVAKKSFQFIDNYLNEIKTESASYPKTFSNVKKIIETRLKEYDEYLKELKAQKELEQKLYEEEEKRREQLRKEEEERRRKQQEEHLKMKKKLEECLKSIEQEKTIIRPPETDEIPSINENHPAENLEEISEIKKQGGIFIEEDSPFTTFTSLGLKRKNMDEDEEF